MRKNAVVFPHSRQARYPARAISKAWPRASGSFFVCQSLNLTVRAPSQWVVVPGVGDHNNRSRRPKESSRVKLAVREIQRSSSGVRKTSRLKTRGSNIAVSSRTIRTSCRADIIGDGYLGSYVLYIVF